MRKTKVLDQKQIAALMGCTPARAVSRLVALGYTEVCSRCGGCGRYSWNQISGDVCFGCNGSGKGLARITAEVVTEALAKIAAGALDGYFAENKARREIKSAVAATQAAWAGTQIARDYTTWSNASSRSAMERARAGLEPYPADHLEQPVFRAMGLINQIMDRAWAQERGKATGLERIAIVRAAREMILAIDAAWAAFSA